MLTDIKNLHPEKHCKRIAADMTALQVALADGRQLDLDACLMRAEEFARHMENDRWKVRQCASMFTSLLTTAEGSLRINSAFTAKELVRVGLYADSLRFGFDVKMVPVTACRPGMD